MTDTMCCGQPVAPTGFCDICGQRKIAKPVHHEEPTPPPATSSWGGTDVYALSSLPVGEPSLLTDPAYPERRQFCG
ncbi:MAG TPA: hypothetical protein VL652_32365, partial [Kutzneria sp.]|nr:hypothetical protein [Kutzneria sp.]